MSSTHGVRRDDPEVRDHIAEAADRWHAEGWGQQAPALAAVKSLLRAQRTYSALADAVLAPFDLNEARYEVLIAVHLHPDHALGHAELGRRLQVSPAAVTSAVEKLHRAGYLDRRENPADRRQKSASLTPRGRDAAVRASTAINRAIFDATGLENDELDLLRRLTTVLSRSLSASRDAENGAARP